MAMSGQGLDQPRQDGPLLQPPCRHRRPQPFHQPTTGRALPAQRALPPPHLLGVGVRRRHSRTHDQLPQRRQQRPQDPAERDYLGRRPLRPLLQPTRPPGRHRIQTVDQLLPWATTAAEPRPGRKDLLDPAPPGLADSGRFAAVSNALREVPLPGCQLQVGKSWRDLAAESTERLLPFFVRLISAARPAAGAAPSAAARPSRPAPRRRRLPNFFVASWPAFDQDLA